MGNPFNVISEQQLDGLAGLDGFSFSRAKKKLKRAVRKVAKIAAPIVVGIVAGPAAGVAVANQVLERRKMKKELESDKKEAKKHAEELGISWEDYQKVADGKMTLEEAQGRSSLTKLTNNPQAGVIANRAADQIYALENSPQVQAINQRLAQNGYTAEQRQQMFMQSEPVQSVVQGAAGAAIYGGVLNAGHSPAVAAITAGRAVEKAEESNMVKEIMPYIAMGVPLLMMAMG